MEFLVILAAIVLGAIGYGALKFLENLTQVLDDSKAAKFQRRQRRMKIPKDEQERTRKARLDAQKQAHRSTYSSRLRKVDKRTSRAWKNLQRSPSPAKAVKYSKLEEEQKSLKKAADRYASIMMRRDAAKEKREAKKQGL